MLFVPLWQAVKVRSGWKTRKMKMLGVSSNRSYHLLLLPYNSETLKNRVKTTKNGRFWANDPSTNRTQTPVSMSNRPLMAKLMWFSDSWQFFHLDKIFCTSFERSSNFGDLSSHVLSGWRYLEELTKWKCWVTQKLVGNFEDFGPVWATENMMNPHAIDL